MTDDKPKDTPKDDGNDGKPKDQAPNNTPAVSELVEAAQKLKTGQEELKLSMEKLAADKLEFKNLMTSAEQNGRSLVNASNGETEQQREEREQKERFKGTGLNPFREVKDPFMQ